MSNEYGFFASKDHDRQYSADDFSAFFGDFFTDGVLGKDTNAIAVSAAGDMKLSISAGAAYAKGRWYRTKSAVTLELSDSDTVYPRIDAVVIRFDYEQRMVYPFIIEGVPAENPANAEHTRNDKYFDLVLAYIYVAANCTEVTDANITDMRGFDSVCGFVTSAIDHIDTSGLFAQYKAQWELLKAACADDAERVISAWDELNSARSVNGIEAQDGNISLVQGDIPSGKGAFPFPAQIQYGTVALSGVTSGSAYAHIYFPKIFKSAPLVYFSGSCFTQNNMSVPTDIGFHSITVHDVYIVATTSNGARLGYPITVNWIALGEFEE